MGDSKFDVLAALVLSGEATGTQKIEFEEMLKASKDRQIAFEKLKRVWQIDLEPDNEEYHEKRQYLWARYQALRHSYKQKQRVNLLRGIAASVMLLVLAGFALYILLEQDSGSTVAVKNIVKETNAGEKLRTQLPDGTSVYLNAGSRLIYPETFSDSSRIIRFKGEGYFDVAEDKNRPFTVRTETMDITALGTAFSVNAYSKNSFDQVALVSGKLLIQNSKNQTVRIDSGQTATLSKVDSRFFTSTIDYLNQVAWKDGLLHFDDNSFEEIREVLALNYGVKFMQDRQIRGTYSGSFKDESLDNILKVLSFSMNFTYKINGKKVTIMENKKTGP